jgi:RimJ/RimL family protein N-acetyltransferase
MNDYKTYLRALEPEDIEKINEYHNNETVFSRVMANKFFISLERDKAWAKKLMMDDKEAIYWSICLRENDKMVGYTSLINIDLRNRKAYIGGVTIDQEYQNQKLAQDAYEQVFNYGFYELGLNKMNTGYLEDHIVSEIIFMKFGFVKEMLLREEIYKLGKFHNVVIVSVLSSEYKRLK